jgi:tetratricopeptide (TPR) repeat protein
MGNENSTVVDKSGDAEKAEQTSAISKGVGAHRPTNHHMVQTVFLIMFDNNSADCRNTITQLRRVVNTVHMCIDADECIEFINSITENKACIIISGLLGEHIVPRIHNIPHLDSIFIFCDHNERHEHWVKEWPIIKGVFTETSSVCVAVKQAVQQREQNGIPISFMAIDNDTFSKNFDQFDPSFMITKILKEILLSTKFDQQHINQFISYCRNIFNDNEYELENVNNLKRSYSSETPIKWYTCECFLYSMLNRALRLMNMDLIMKMGFFIGDLHRHIERLHHEQLKESHTSTVFTVYRGQGLSKIDLDRLMITKGSLMSFNNFLTSSKDRDISLGFAYNALANPDSVGVLFVMTIDPSKSSTPFASITDVDCFQKENEILFSMHTVFRIHDIKPMPENERLFEVDLTLTADNDKDVRMLTDRIQEEIEPNATGWDRLGSLLHRTGQSKKAQQVYEVLLNQTTNKIEKAVIYDQLGKIKFEQGEFKDALILCEKALEILQKNLPSTHNSLADSYNNVGLIYETMGQYSTALTYYTKAFKIKQQRLSSYHPSLAICYNNFGAVYYNMNEYAKALSSYGKTLEIRRRSLPPNHPDLATSYSNIGSLYGQMGENAKALPYFEKAHEIYQKSLLPNHPAFAMIYGNIGNVYCNMEQYSKALSFYERAVDIGQRSLAPPNSELKRWKNNLDSVQDKL